MSQLTLWLAASLLLVPTVLYLTYRKYRTLTRRLEREHRHAQQMSELHLATIEALALAIDAKDQTAHNHIRRVQIYGTALARALGMSEEEIQAVKTAALLHDIGKLAVPEHILAKAGPLTPEEFQKVRIHPQVGAEIIGNVAFPYPVAPLILSHHERWDGRGYPDGLEGEEIPEIARIVAVAEVYDTLTAPDTYRTPLTSFEALNELRRVAGKQLDESVVESLASVLAGRGTDYRHADAADYDAELDLLRRVDEAARG
jgi:putative nucleotidyltransferase with HDIG domain